ncbi:MAG: tRNA (adenosine(37)-N6)-dimethylallyltransferase MiaA [Candidatus Moranbacteria bacterium]|nr:tRNA (adenosine(37)-N6)-dimethylallyltransferase MiaA [bacterium]MDP1834259.1 tRNA (adenosine(37)-N6)-dimethylallyltransferase MiaA [Candidatus Moranbacteria bacterium]
MESRRKIIVILGPTSAGKSAVAVRLAQKFDGEIVSVDSRQVYRGMDVGTGKITSGEQAGIKHWMLDIVSPRTDFSAAQFKKRADKTILDILRRGKLPILCGGTGFWIKSVVDNVTYPEVKPDWVLRNNLSNESAEELFGRLQKIDPQRAKNIDAKNKVRLIRAIEICKTLGQVPAEKSDPQYRSLQIGLDVPKDELHAKIKKRLDRRWRDGMIEEVKRLHQQGLNWKKIQSFGLGYFWIPEYLRKKISLEELYAKVYLAEKDYAKRQITWFKKDNRIIWLPICRKGRVKYEDIEKEVVNFLQK